MTSRNEHTGDTIKTKAPSKEYDEGWDRIFGNKNKSTGTLEMVNKVESLFIDPLCKICGKELANVRECGWTSCPKWSSYSATDFEET